jgi:hypothetical protein
MNKVLKEARRDERERVIKRVKKFLSRKSAWTNTDLIEHIRKGPVA